MANISQERKIVAIAMFISFLLIFSLTLAPASPWNLCKLKKAVTTATVAAGLSFGAAPGAHAAGALPNRDIYFGVGCYWHVMHEFVQTEQNVLGRGTKEVTSAAGYGGSKLVGKDSNRPDNKKGVVCYHNLMGVGDYGSLGYGEVVGMDLPKTEGAMRAFAKEYFSLFKNGDRPDLGDRGLEYRSLIGLPGGMNSPLFKALEEEAVSAGQKLVAGKGGDTDTSGKKIVWIYDSDEFPFRQAEIYHQFHDGFMPGEQYPQAYNDLAREAYFDGRIEPTGCPDSIPRG